MSNLDEEINNFQYDLDKLKFVKSKINDVKLYSNTNKFLFGSASVNSNYTNFDFINNYSTLSVEPYILIDFPYDGKITQIKINSIPMRNKLAYISDLSGRRVLKFSRLSFNFKNRKFDEELLKNCQSQILKFIQKNGKIEIDTKHLDARLKKLLSFM